MEVHVDQSRCYADASKCGRTDGLRSAGEGHDCAIVIGIAFRTKNQHTTHVGNCMDNCGNDIGPPPFRKICRTYNDWSQ